MLAKTQTRRVPTRSRRGAASVELAVSLPFLLALTFGMLEYNNKIMLRTRMVAAAYESARLATRPTTSQTSAASASSVVAYCNNMLTQLGVNGATVTVSPSNLSSVSPQTAVTVTVNAPLSQNSLTSVVINSSSSVTVNATLVVE
ncbi:TadE/TadG family type IV pilus assembly protein [Schlesneria paludicola]|uniref:TadE/TadG family type IV pilus assembly protein n=1 Tax=Schlesneria paludicola TaxID=360056 RepID=UPI000299D6C0|nr:TadE/TadG family type IV pilus assembly protein [Schlesneria paludicola]